MIRTLQSFLATAHRFVVVSCWTLLILPSHAQEKAGETSVSTSIGGDGMGKIIVEAHGQLPEPPLFFSASANATAKVGSKFIDQTVNLKIKVIQGEAGTLSFGLNGAGQITEVRGEQLNSWSVRQQGSGRFLDLHLQENTNEAEVDVKIRSLELDLPAEIEFTHLTPGKSIGFDSKITINYTSGLTSTLLSAVGFVPIDGNDESDRFQTTTGGLIKLAVKKDGTSPAAVELSDSVLRGVVHPDGSSISFELRTTAQVNEPNSKIQVLSGHAAVSQVPVDSNYRLRLAGNSKHPFYELVFVETGRFSVILNFVADLDSSNANWRRLDFTIAASAVVPMTITGLSSDLEFHRDQQSIVPLRENDAWLGFLPATGRAKMQWKASRKTGEGKLFFSTAGQVEAKIGAGLLRQDHQIDYHVLQGELNSLRMTLNGPGEILNVQGANIVGWKVTGEGDNRQLEATLSQPITSSSRIKVRSQTPLGAFPVRVEGLRLTPIGAIRHSGFLRLTNLGSVRLEPTDLAGLTQLAPEQFPGDAIKARQIFVYRFPAANYAFTMVADRIQPEVNIAELVLYQLAETDRVIKADIELDVREAPIREWDFGIPSDYSVVSVTGARVADYITASAETNGRRNLKVIFGRDVAGRQLVKLYLEKNIAANEEDWSLPRIEYPEAKTVRGDIGVIGAPGFRIAVVATDLLVEKPLSYFPKPTANLQQAFRIREPGWSATMHIEPLERNVQSDVFHLYSLSEGTVYGSALINFFVTGAPVSEWTITVPESLENVIVDGQDVRTWRRDGDTLIVSLHQAVMGPYTLLVTFEEKPNELNGSFQAGLIAPTAVQGERGFIQVVSPMQVEISTVSVSDGILVLDPLELPAEFRLLSTAPPLGTWQYTERPFDLNLKVNWFHPGTIVTQVVEFSEANSRVSQDGELVTDVLYYVKSRGRQTLKIKLPNDPVRLWEVSVNGQPVTARQADDATLIPLPGSSDPNIPIEVRLRLGKPTVDESMPLLTLPTVFAPVLKTQWNVTGDEKRILVPEGGTVTPPIPVLRPTGYEWVARHGLLSLVLILLSTSIGIWAGRKTGFLYVLGILALGVAVCISVATAMMAQQMVTEPAPLQLSLPIHAAGEAVELQVKNMPLWQAHVSWVGLSFLAGGMVGLLWSLLNRSALRPWLPVGGFFLIAIGILLQPDSAPWLYAILALTILMMFLIPRLWHGLCFIHKSCNDFWQRRRSAKKTDADDPSTGAAVTATILLALLSPLFGSDRASAADDNGFSTFDSVTQQWQVTRRDQRLKARVTLTLSGKPGDQFMLLKAPAVLTGFEGEGLRLTKSELPGQALTYIVSIPVAEPTVADKADVTLTEFQATFEFQLEAIDAMKGIPVLTGRAAVQAIDFTYDEAGWEVFCPTAVRVEPIEHAEQTKVNLLLKSTAASKILLRPKARDVTAEETQFFVEASNLYLPGPGVVDGRHRLHIRPAQGQLDELIVLVPQGVTVSAVSGPVGSWQFDAESGRLKLQIEPTQSQAFNVMIDTQRSLAPLPADVNLAPLRVNAADGEVGLLAIAFGPDAQPERSDPNNMSTVNLGDFDAKMLPQKQAVLHRVYRYGAEGGELALRVAPVDSEVRVFSKQVLSLGNERTVLAANFVAEISRAGLFQLSFPLPEGLEVESLTGDSLHHWSELSEVGERKIILHLNGKTIGTQNFSLTLAGPAPSDVGEWEMPRFELQEATRQTGELVVRPTTGIRLRTVSRQNVSETDPRSLGGNAKGALAFRLLQRDWNLVLGVEKLDPWVTGQVLHEISLREGQTRTALIANFHVQNASIRTLKVILPTTNDDEIKTLRASGKTVSDFIRTAPDSNLWEVQFKRRVVGSIQFQIEYERRGDRENESEVLSPAGFPDARQLSYYFGVRAGGRLEIGHGTLSQGWQRADWTTVPQILREAGNRNAPALTFRAVAPANGLTLTAKRHSLEAALKLRVAKGTLTTVLSPTGDQLTAVDMTMDVIQRSSLSIGLPVDGELFSIFVNGESVHSIRQNNGNAWQFYILPGIDDRTASVRFVYSVPGDGLDKLKLSSPQMNVPLENIEWNVIAPRGFELLNSDGTLELVRQAKQQNYDRDSYLSKISGKRQVQAQQAAELLEQANQLLQQGQQSKARWALNSVANQYALDAASNEDARVQLENLQKQQAVVGLNTRRQRLYLDNNRDDTSLADNKQLRQAAADNPILQQDQLNFRPQQLSQLLRGNTTEDNAILQQIAGRLVQHQRTTEPAPQAILISLPEEGTVYAFRRSVQVSENSPLELDLQFQSQRRLEIWQIATVLVVLTVFSATLGVATKRRVED